jgi:hypothetical protein
MPNWKTLIKKYGVIFSLTYIGTFILLVTFYSRYEFPTFPGDILINRGGFFIYLPFTSSLASAAFVTILTEAYKVFKNY